MKDGFVIRTAIQKPRPEVFQAILDPEQVTKFFPTSSSGALVEGATTTWSWKINKGRDEISSEVFVDEVLENERISFRWQAWKVDYHTTVALSFELDPENDNETFIVIEEKGWNLQDENDLESAFEHCAGWQHMMMCLKGWLMHGLDLRA